MAYAFSLFPPAEKKQFRKYERIHDVELADGIRPLLAAVNGCFAHGISLYGMPPSMSRDTPQIDRSRLQCYDIATANIYWRHSYSGDSGGFHFGSRNYSRKEDVGYFLFGGSHIVSMLQGGDVAGEWDDFASFLVDELAASEQREYSHVPDDWWH